MSKRLKVMEMDATPGNNQGKANDEEMSSPERRSGTTDGMEIDSEIHEDTGKEDNVTVRAETGEAGEDAKGRKDKQEEKSKERKGGRRRGAKSGEESK